MIRYIHGKEWDAKLLEALITDSMKLGINTKSGALQAMLVLETWNLPSLQFGEVVLKKRAKYIHIHSGQCTKKEKHPIRIR